MITPEELAAAKAQLAKHNIDRITRNLPEDDRELLKKYPKHTLAAARLIDSVQSPRPPLLGHIMHEAGEDFLRIQRQACGDSTFNQ